MSTEANQSAAQAKPPVVFSARPFAFVAPFRAQQDIRYYLNGVAVQAHPISGVVIAATNGHQLAIAYDPKGHTDRDRIFSISKDLEKAAKKTRAAFIGLKAGRLTLINHLDGLELDAWDDAQVLEAFVQVGGPQIEGTFPDLLRMLPNSQDDLEPGLKGAIAARYAANAAKAASFISPKYAATSHWTRKNDGSILTRFATDPNFLLVTMPLRDEAQFKDLPNFLAPMRSARDERLKREEEAKEAEVAAAATKTEEGAAA